ncbi:MAG: hypothetical protein ACRBFS_25040 [Aureispira sp.]
MKGTLILLIIFISLFNESISAQRVKCSVEKDQTSGERIFKSSYRNGDLKIEQKEGEIIKLFWTINYSGQQSVAFEKGAKFVLKLADDNIIICKTINEAFPELLLGTYTDFTRYSFILEVKKEQLAQLASSPIVFSRTPNPVGKVQDETDIWRKRNQKIYQNLFECINSNK